MSPSDEDEERAESPLLATPDDPTSDSRTPQNTLHGLWLRCHRFLDGPRPPQPPVQRLYLANLQKRLDAFADSLGSRARTTLFWALFYLFWFSAASSLIYRSSFSAESSSANEDPPVFISCVSTFWRLKNGCGIDGRDCEPMNGTSLNFRCPANCRAETVLNDRPIGDQVVIHVPLVIGGQGQSETESGIYRADSFICASAIHAGVVTDRAGGCGKVNMRGPRTGFESSLANDVQSIAFESEFPKSFSFTKLERFGGCRDLRWSITYVNMAFSAAHSLLQASPIWYYWILFLALYFHIALVSDPPSTTGLELISVAFRGLLPSLFVGYAFWITAVRWTLEAAPPLDRTLFWLGGLWFGALLNYISDHIPISRLLMSDIVRDGGLFWFIGVVALVVAIMLGQMNMMRKAGHLVYYLKIYLTGLFVLIALSCIPGLTFRLHHYIFGLILVPGTAYPTRLSMLYQGILVGLFLDGIARWGFDSILETAEHLREDGALFSDVPAFLGSSDWRAAGSVSWLGTLSPNFQYSVLVNEVERYRGPTAALAPDALGLQLFPDVPYYFRIAYAYGGSALDYSRAAILWANGTFVPA